MVWCGSCSLHCRGERRDEFIICNRCGKVLEHDNFSNEPTFTKGAGGQSTLSGNFVRTIQNTLSISRERTLSRARMDMEYMVTALGLSGGDSLVNQSLAFYTIAADRGFTKGRRVGQVEASCLYIACRENKKPFLLIDFSEYLRVNVYVLGAVFLQLCKLLSLEEHPIVQKPVDPSLFIHRFTGCLIGSSNPEVSKTAIHILASMKRDWMQTGRKPSGLCGAALYISALSHGVKCTKSDVIRVVHVCESTLMKRLIEFEETKSGALTLEEFKLKADELDKFSQSGGSFGIRESVISQLLCEHKGSERIPYSHGLCRSCYDDFMTLSGGIDGGLDPPAFQRAERERGAAATTESNTAGIADSHGQKLDVGEVVVGVNKVVEMPDVEANKVFPEKTLEFDVDNEVSEDESCGLSDIDDSEVDGYLHNEEEKRLKKIIWEELNKEYLEEQAVKEAAAAAAREAFEANFEGRPEELKAAQELATAVAAAVSKSRKERQRKRAEEITNMGPPQTAAEATRQMLTKKRLSSKINYDVLDKLFDEPADSEPKRSKVGYPSEDDANEQDVEIDNDWGEAGRERGELYNGEKYTGYDGNVVDEYGYFAEDYTSY